MSPSATYLNVTGTAIDIFFGGGTNDYDVADDFPNGIRVNSVTFKASASTDIIIIRSKTAAGAILLSITGSNTVTYSQPVRMFPYIDRSEQTFNNASNAVLIFQLA